ncbi:MAG: helix-turn-helix domain-containing protein [Polyangiaceae bacterium]
MKRYAWPGNVRELRNIVDRAVFVADGAAAEAAIILEALRAANGNQSEAARALKMPLRTLVFKLKRHGIRKLGYEVG